MKSKWQWIAGAAILAFAGAASAQDYVAILTNTLNGVAIDLNATAQQGLRGNVSGAVSDGATLLSDAVTNLSRGTPLAGVAGSGVLLINDGNTILGGTLTSPLDGLLKPVLFANGTGSTTALLGSGSTLVLGKGFPILGSGLLGSNGGVPLAGFVQSGLSGNPLGALLATFGQPGQGTAGLIPVLGGNSIPLISGVLANPSAIPVLGPVLNSLLGGAGSLNLGSGGIPVIGSLLGSSGGIPVIGSLLGSSGGIPVIGGLLGGSGSILGGSGLSLTSLPLPLNAIDPSTLLALTNGVALPGL